MPTAGEWASEVGAAVRRPIAVPSLALAALVAVALLAEPAAAKGIARAAITGPDLVSPIVLGPTDAIDLMPSRTPRPTRPAGPLGPAYRAKVLVGFPGSPRGRANVVLYPLAPGGPWVHRLPGPALPIEDAYLRGWWPAQPALLPALIDRGLLSGTARITGPGLARPVELPVAGPSGFGAEISLGAVLDRGLALSPTESDGRLGPPYEVTIRFAGGDVVLGRLYPYARWDGVRVPYLELPGGQRAFGLRMPAGWLAVVSPELFQTLRDGGLPAFPPRAGSAPPPAPWAPPLALVLEAALLALAAALTLRRNRRPPVALTAAR